MLHIALVDGKRLRLLQVDPDGVLVEVRAMEDGQAVTHERDLRGDRPGRMVNTADGSHATFEPKHSARSISLHRWLKVIGVQLRSFVEEERSDGIVLVASSRLLGLLRVAVPIEVRRKVLVELARDLAKHTTAGLQARLKPTIREARIRLRERSAVRHPQRHGAGDRR